MHTVDIPKKSGGTRTLYVPNRDEKALLTAEVGRLTAKARQLDRAGVVHGFARQRSAITNAQAHVGHAYSVCFDLSDFFESVTADRLRGKLSAEELSLVLVDGAARQGLPTSPAVANIAASDLDKAILKWVTKMSKQLIYTRYADDLTFSFDDPALIPIIRRSVPEIVGRTGFRINPAKTRVQAATAGRRIICGVAVDDTGIHPTRQALRKLRAARHQGHLDHASGLEEWCKLRPPATRSRASASTLDEVEAVCRAWRLAIPRWYRTREFDPAIPDQDLGDGCIITNDPVYVLGMSTITSGWTSCMRHPGGQYRRGVWVWVGMDGTSIAAKLSARTDDHGGVVRRRMAARVLVHQLRDGRRIYDRPYGGDEAIEELVAHLRAAGFVSVAEAAEVGGSDGRVVGNVPLTTRPWADSLSLSRVRLRSGGSALTLKL